MTVKPELPLAGIVVADFSRVLAGPLCTQLLADAGARVIKIEEPRRGDETRRWGPPFVSGVSAYFLSINRNKESVAIDLRSARGIAVARRLVAMADVVVDNFLPAQRRALLPDIPARAVHCTITGFDRDTPQRDTPGYDLLAQADSGMMSITGEPDGDPMKSGVAVADILTAHYACGAIAAALVRRERSGRGARIEVSLFDAALASLVNVAQSVLLTGREAKRFGNAHPSIVPYGVFHAADRPFALGVGTDRHFQLLCTDVLRRPALAADARFSTNAARVRHRAALTRMLAREFRTRRAAAWVARCRRASVPASLVRGVREALRTAAGRAMTGELEHPVLGRYGAVCNPLRIDGARLGIGTPPPALGQQTGTILREIEAGRYAESRSRNAQQRRTKASRTITRSAARNSRPPAASGAKARKAK
jgi:crotonobetainyl-CoA:carnitine CoA-transferase CaiB-like acyl-CoA transferase